MLRPVRRRHPCFNLTQQLQKFFLRFFEVNSFIAQALLMNAVEAQWFIQIVEPYLMIRQLEPQVLLIHPPEGMFESAELPAQRSAQNHAQGIDKIPRDQ